MFLIESVRLLRPLHTWGQNPGFDVARVTSCPACSTPERMLRSSGATSRLSGRQVDGGELIVAYVDPQDPRATAVKPDDVILKMDREHMKKIPWLVNVGSLKKETELNL